MTQRKPILRLGPQKTDFFGTSFSKGLSGHNWEFDARGKIVRRHGAEETVLPINEPEVYGMDVPPRFGLRHLQEFKRPRLDPAPYFSEHHAELDSDFLFYNTEAISSYSPTELVGIGCFPWQIVSLRVARAVETLRLSVQALDGVKTVLVYDENEDLVTSVLASSPTVSFVTAAASVLQSVGDAQFQALTTLRSLPYGDTVMREGDLLLLPLPRRLPTSVFCLDDIVFTGSAHGMCGDYDATPKTSAQIGNYLYIAGGGGPLMRYDGSRLHAAGASTLLRAYDAGDGELPAAPSLVGTGITGTYRYGILHRVYGPDGAYTDGPMFDLTGDPVVAANQTVRWTINRLATAGNMLLPGDGFFAPDSNGQERLLNPMYKCTDFRSNGSGTFANSFDVRVSEAAGIRAEFWPGDPIFAWHTLTQVTETATVEHLHQNGDITCCGETFNLAIPGNVVCAGDMYVLYRTLNGGTIYYQIAEFPVGIEYYDDSLTDANLLADPAFYPQYLDTAYYRAPPPACAVAVCAHQTRIVVAHRDNITELTSEAPFFATPATTVSWSEPGTEHFPPENSISLAGECTAITGLKSVNDTLYIFTDRGTFFVAGSLVSPETFTLSRLPSTTVNGSPSGPVITPRGLEYLSSEGELVLVINGNSAVLNTTVLSPTDYDMTQVVGVYVPTESRAYFFVPKISGAKVEADRTPGVAYDMETDVPLYAETSVVVVDYLREGLIYQYQIPAAAVGGAVATKNGVLFSNYDADQASSFRQLMRGAPADADGADIQLSLKAPFEDAESPHLHKVFQRLTVFDPDSDHEFTLGVKVEKDWDTNRFIQSFSLSFRADEGFANDPFAADPFADGVIPDREQSLNNFKAKSLRVTFEHEDKTENPVINGWALEYSDTARESRES